MLSNIDGFGKHNEIQSFLAFVVFCVEKTGCYRWFTTQMWVFPCIFSYLPFDYCAENGMYSYIHRCLHCLPFGHLYIYLLFLLLIISLALGSLALEWFRRGSTNRCIHCVNWMIYWTTWNNSLPYMTQVIKAFTLNFSSFFITN